MEKKKTFTDRFRCAFLCHDYDDDNNSNFKDNKKTTPNKCYKSRLVSFIENIAAPACNI